MRNLPRRDRLPPSLRDPRARRPHQPRTGAAALGPLQLVVFSQRAFEPEVGFRVLVVGGHFAVAGGEVEADGGGEVVGGVEADRPAAVFEGDLVQPGEDAAAEAGAPVGRRHVHALHLGDLGVEVADAAEPGRLAASEGEEEGAVGRHQVSGRAGGDLGVEVDPRFFAVVDKRPVRLPHEVGVEVQNAGIVALDRFKKEIHENDANALQNFSNLRATRASSPGTILSVTRKELSAVVAECAARSERAEASIRESRAGIEVARRKQEEATAKQKDAIAKQEDAIARQEAATAKLNEIQAEQAERDKRQAERDKRQEEMLAEMRSANAEMKAERERMAREAEANLEATKAEWATQREEDRIWRQEYLRRQEKMFQDFFKRAEELVAQGTINTEKILVAIRDQQEDIRAMKDAIFKLIDRFPPPPPHLRSA